jgi:glycosyltransferase involved in cell wall biosynthesis
MKLLIVAPYFFESHRWMISAYKSALFLSRRMEVVVLTTGRPKYEELNPRLRIYRMRDWFLPDPVNYSLVPGLAWNLWRVVRRERPDVFLVNKYMFFTSFAVWWLRLMGKKVILATDTFPGINWHPRHPVVRVVMTIYAYLLGWPILKAANRLIVFHEDLLPVARKLGLPAEVIHHGVDLQKIDQAPRPADLQKEPGQIFVCYVGRLESIKGYYDFIRAAQSMALEHPQVTFFLIGSHQGKAALVRSASTSNIRFLGHRDDVASLLKVMDIFVLPSYSEGLPNALMEAMAARVACLSSRVGGVKVLIHEGIEGLTYPAGDVPALQRQLEKLIRDRDLRHRLGENARRRIAAEFDWAVIADKYQQLFQSILVKTG